MGNPKPEVVLVNYCYSSTVIKGKLSLGDEITFFYKKNISEITKVGEVNGNKYNYVVTIHGNRVNLMHLIRNRNGLQLDGKTRDERYASFNDLFSEVGENDEEYHGWICKLRVVKEIERTAIFDGEEKTIKQYVFELI